MKTILAIFFASFCLGLAAEPQLFVEGSFHNLKGDCVGWFRQVCVDKKGAEQLLAKYTNSVTGIAPGLDVRARVHICKHDSTPPLPCVVELLTKEEPVLSADNTNYCVKVVEVTTTEKQSIRDNPPQFKVPATKATEAALIAKIKAEEFAGKQVTTNAGTASLEAVVVEVPK